MNLSRKELKNFLEYCFGSFKNFNKSEIQAIRQFVKKGYTKYTFQGFIEKEQLDINLTFRIKECLYEAQNQIHRQIVDVTDDVED